MNKAFQAATFPTVCCLLLNVAQATVSASVAQLASAFGC